MPINKINVFSQTANKRTLVGILYRHNGNYFFEYDRAYRILKSAISFGPEFELWKEKFSSRELFPSLLDRIPSRQNPAYGDYCKQWGIAEDEGDPFVLLTTIGRRGPSTFVFEAVSQTYSPEDIKAFRNKLNLNQREFSLLFGISQATLSKLEKGKSSYPTIESFIRLCEEVPQAMMWLLKTRGQYIHDDKRVRIEEFKQATSIRKTSQRG